MFRLVVFVLVVIAVVVTEIHSWPIRKRPMKFDSNETCCILAKLHINATRANLGRNFFAEIIFNNNSYKDINEENICSLMHFFMQEAVLNGRPITFSKGINIDCNGKIIISHVMSLGMFVLYDSTKQFFTQLMKAKETQKHGSGEDRSGYYKRLKYFTLSHLKKLFNSKKLNQSIPETFIYVRGDESSHFRERGKKDDRKKKYPA